MCYDWDMIAKILPITKIVGENHTFDYLVPDEFSKSIQVGSLVSIPFGNRKIRGIVIEIIRDAPRSKYKIKNILSIDPNFVLPQKYFDIAKWVANKYICSIGESLGMFLPPEMVRPRVGKEQGTRDEGKKAKITLSKDQQEIFDAISNQQSAKIYKPVLVHGVTGSGKTEIYIKLIEQVINSGKQSVVLVPEIMLTPQTVERLVKYFGERVALLHSSLSKSEKYQSYYEFYRNEKAIIIGPRSALLVPTENIGIVIIDEEQEDSYKQDQTPRYHAVDLAEKIAQSLDAQLILGTATPRITTYHKSKTGAYSYYHLPERHGEAKIPKSTIVDLRNEIKGGNYSPISLKLQSAIRQTLENKKQVLLFLNRRGLATFVSCRDCGYIVICDNCQIPMVYHLQNNGGELVCHHCDAKKTTLAICPECKSPRIKYFGAGTEKVYQEIRNLFPGSRVLLVTADTVKSKDDYLKIFNKIKEHEVDIVIGTQMIAKGLDIPNVDLVGIVSADVGLHLPHFRSSERTFQLVTQVSGRAGRRDDKGEVIVQTYWPESLAIFSATNNDFDSFYQNEISERKKFGYPPFSDIIRIVVENISETKAREEAETIKKFLQKSKIDFIGPAKCFHSKINKRHRYHIIIKSGKIKPIIDWSTIAKSCPHTTIDVDPTSLL